MPKLRLRHAFVAVMIMLAMLAQGTWALAGTTGGISGTLTDSSTGKPLAGATISAVSPSQSATTTTDAGGRFNFLALAPDTYTVSASKDGYAPQSIAGVSVFADQSYTLSFTTHPELKTIATARTRAAGNLVKPGTTADVYSVNAATQAVVSSAGGGFNMNSAYSALYQQPGVTSYIGNYGWGQVFYIRGAAYGQTGYEFDGVPVNRAFDNYQANSLSNLGQQELQVYTGGSPAGASSATLGGFINQVIKTGTYPGFGTLKAGIGAPAFYHALTAEAGGANPNRTFSWYAGLNGYNQAYPYWNNSSGNNILNNGLSQYGFQAPATIAPWSWGLYNSPTAPDGANAYGQWLNGPWPACQNGGVNGGVAVGQTAAAPGVMGGTCLGYGVFGAGYYSNQEERNTVLNFHFGIPHKNNSLRDDLQLLYDGSMQYMTINSSLNANGGMPFISGYLNQFAGDANGVWANTPEAGLCGYENDFNFGCAQTNSPLPYFDSFIFAPGTQFGQQVSNSKIVPYYFPSSPTNRVNNSPGNMVSGLSPNLYDGQWNDVGIVKAQYTKNFTSNFYARAFGYTFYSDWLNMGPDCAATGYFDGYLQGSLCGNTADYELATHTRGAELQLVDQLNSQNLLQFTGNYTTASVSRFNNGSWEASYAGSRKIISDLTNGDPNNPVCYNALTVVNPKGVTVVQGGAPGSCFSTDAGGTFSHPTAGSDSRCAKKGYTCTPIAALPAGAQWLVTVPGGQGTFNTVQPKFSSFALTDDFKPNDKLDLNLGVRLETYEYDLTNSNTPEMNYWFNAAAETQCYDPKTGLPALTPLAPGQPVPPNPVQTQPFGNCNANSPAGTDQYVHPIGPVLGATAAGQACVAAQQCTTSAWYSAQGASKFTHSLVSPRIGATYTLDPDNVLRFSAGKYTQPTETAFEQYLDQSGKRAAAFDFSQFWGLGYQNPSHDNPVQYSNNYDFSIEHHFHNTDWTMKVSPYYRDTHNEIVSLVLGPGFVSGVNVGHQHSYGLELAIQKGDPSRDGLSGQLSYTYSKALIQYGNLPNGTNGIDYLNNYIKAFNALTKAGGGSPCYDSSTASAAACPTTPTDWQNNPTIIQNPYYNMNQQGLLDREGWYPTYANEPPNDPNDQPSTAIAPHTIAGWIQYKHGRWAVAPNFELISGNYYGSPTDMYGTDPRSCGNNQANSSNAALIPQADWGYCDFLQAAPSPFTQSGDLAVPNPYTGTMDSMGQYQNPWQLNIGALIHYDISPKISANLSLTNIVNTCFGGSSTPWSKQFKPNNYVCGYNDYSGGYLGAMKGQPGFGGGFYYGDSPSSAANASPTYATAMNYPFYPFSGALPFQAYLDVQIKL